MSSRSTNAMDLQPPAACAATTATAHTTRAARAAARISQRSDIKRRTRDHLGRIHGGGRCARSPGIPTWFRFFTGTGAVRRQGERCFPPQRRLVEPRLRLRRVRRHLRRPIRLPAGDLDEKRAVVGIRTEPGKRAAVGAVDRDFFFSPFPALSSPSFSL